jgi:pimeloyl-ACP methyl ester carboxylesterase
MPEDPVALPEVPEETIRGFIEHDFAFGLCSYAHNGWAVESGFECTEEVRQIAVHYLQTNLRTKTRYTYVAGHSLGGLIAIMLAETYPDRYSGALPMCAPLGGASQQIAYVGDVRALFDYYFQNNYACALYNSQEGYWDGIIPTTERSQPAVNVPEGLPWEGAEGYLNIIRDAVLADLEAAREMASVDQIKLPYGNDDQLVSSILQPLWFSVRGTNNFISLAGGSSYDNRATVFSRLGVPIDKLNDRDTGVIRYAPTSTATVRYTKDYYDTTGRLNRIPVLTLHTDQDPQVPFAHTSSYEQKVRSAGSSSWLVQRFVDRYGHCAFSNAETSSAMSALVLWVEYAIRPSSGYVTQPD